MSSPFFVLWHRGEMRCSVVVPGSPPRPQPLSRFPSYPRLDSVTLRLPLICVALLGVIRATMEPSTAPKPRGPGDDSGTRRHGRIEGPQNSKGLLRMPALRNHRLSRCAGRCQI
jgi:hypothetical protein